MKAKRKLSRGMKIFIVFITVAALAAAWYFLFFSAIRADIEELDSQIIDTNISIETEQHKNASVNAMRQYLEEGGLEKSALLTYDKERTLEQYLSFLNSLFGRAENYSISFGEPVRGSDYFIRRTYTVNVRADSYAQIRDMIDELENGPYRCIVSSLSITGASDIYYTYDVGLNGIGPLTGNFSITFIETLYDENGKMISDTTGLPARQSTQIDTEDDGLYTGRK